MDAPAKAGDIIDGRYRLERVVGSGGMAVVVAAIDIERSERVALKFLFKKAARHKEILQRFEREKSVIGRLEGEHVARMLGAGIVKNTPYMVMEYLQGRDLADLLRVQ
ncbi:MAG TPA: protein kinase, partial [Polyangiaceae bacterium]|nr:protein kinase [Polyangiaceae bacterium]